MRAVYGGLEPPAGAADRILEVAHQLLYERGIASVGIDTIVARSGASKATLYRHFRSKDELVLAFLQRRERVWTKEWVEAETRQRGQTPEEQLLAIFDLFDEWFRRDDFEGCSFVNVLLEVGDRSHPAGRACVEHLKNIREIVRELADEAGLRDADGFAHALHILMKGSIVAAGEGDVDAARRAKSMARLVIDAYR